MSLGPEIASALIGLEVELDRSQVDAAAVKAAQEFNRAFAGAQKAFASRDKASQTAAAASIAQAFGGMAKQLDIVTPKLSAFQRISGSLNTTMTKFGGAATGAAVGVAGLAAAAIGLTVAFAKVAGEFQELEQGIRAIIENSETANTTTEKFIGNLRNLALQSGRSSAQLANTGRQFLALGFSGDETTKILTTFTKAAALTGATNQQLGLALNGVSQIASKGAVSMEELRRQIAENLPGAVNLSRFFQILAQNMGITEAEARKLQGQGLIGAEEGIKALLQTVNETTDGIDVFALRAQTLNGVLGIIKEGIVQVIQTGFKPFIEIITQTTEGPLGALLKAIRGEGGGIGGALSGLTGLVERFGKVMGESFIKVINEILPLLPGIANLFVILTEALAPLVVDIVKVAGTLGRLLIPVLTVAAHALDILLNKLGPVSFILRQLVAGVLIGGVVKGFQLFGRAVGSAGGLLGRLATPLTRIFSTLSNLAVPIGVATTALGLLGTPIRALIGFIDTAIEKLGQLSSFIANLPGIKQAVDLIGGIGGAIGDIVGGGDKLTKVFEPIRKIKQPTVDLTKVLTDLNSAFEKVIEDQDTLAKAQKAVDDAIQGRIDAIQSEKDARNAVTEAIEDEADAKEKLVEINTKLAEKEAERLKLINDTTADLREVAAAQRDLERIGFRLLDIDQERLDILEKIKELNTPATADELAAADNRITRATIALNRAKREELEAIKALNQEQTTSVDLSGLSLDQLRIRLAGIRASLAAQRAIVKTGKTQEELQEDVTLAHVGVVDAQIEVNEAVQDRIDLDNKVIENQTEIIGLQRDLKQLESDKLGLLDDQVVKQGELNLLVSGETTRAGELKKVDQDIANLKKDQRDATRDIRDATAEILTKQNAVKTATDAIKIAENEIKIAKQQQRIEVATILGTENDINQALRDRIGLNGQLGQQTSQIIAQSLINNFIPNLADIDKVGVEAFVGTSIKNPNFAKQLADMILNNPNKLRDLLRFVGVKGFEKGGLITSPTISMMGEKFKHEMVLPLSNPDRVWSLMSQTLPKYPGALRAAQSAISVPSRVTIPKPAILGSGGRRVVNREDGPATYGQIKELIATIKEQRTEVQIDAPITVQSNGSEQLLLRKLSRQLKRELLDELGKR